MTRDRVSRTLFMFLRRPRHVMLVAYALCVTRTAAATSATADENTGGSNAATVDDLNRSLERLASKLDTLTVSSAPGTRILTLTELFRGARLTDGSGDFPLKHEGSHQRVR